MPCKLLWKPDAAYTTRCLVTHLCWAINPPFSSWQNFEKLYCCFLSADRTDGWHMPALLRKGDLYSTTLIPGGMSTTLRCKIPQLSRIQILKVWSCALDMRIPCLKIMLTVCKHLHIPHGNFGTEVQKTKYFPGLVTWKCSEDITENHKSASLCNYHDQTLRRDLLLLGKIS